jgi:hypothetical protein
MIGSQLLRYHSTGFLCLDTEGESLNVGFTRPWQVAWMLADLKQVHWVKTRWIYWADLRVSRGAAIKTRFNPADYARNARPAAEVLAEFRADLLNPAYRPVWQSGLSYDNYAIRNWERGCGVAHDDSYLLRSVDTNPLLKAIVKGWQPDISSPEAFLAWQYKGANWIEKGLRTNLSDVGKARKIEHDYAGTHDAANDILLMYKIFKEIVYELEV